jgi:predicted O-methyltransferase YrrM
MWNIGNGVPPAPERDRGRNMNPVLRKILDTRTVTDGSTTYSLQFNMDPEEGDLIQRMIARVEPTTTLEVGMAYGVSTLYICDALTKLSKAARHIAIDPYQSEHYHDVGKFNVREAGFDQTVQVIEQESELALPRLLSEGTRIDFAIIDGWHTFDHALVDFFYVSRMLRVGGVVILDDVDWDAIYKLVRYILNYPAYRMIAATGMPRRPRSMMGRLRRGLSYTVLARKFLREDVLTRPWERGWGSCVALEKVAPDERPADWYVDF